MTDDGDFPPKSQRVQRFATMATAAFFAFILGFVPMWLTARTRGEERDAAQQVVHLIGIENALAAAAIYARRGEYEAARVAASTFYAELQAEVDRPGAGSAATSRVALQDFLAERDEIITLLARDDAAVAERLATTYITYRAAAAIDRAPP